MNIYLVESGFVGTYVHACTVGTAVNRSRFGKLQETIGLRVQLIRENVSKKEWEKFKETINSPVPNKKVNNE